MKPTPPVPPVIHPAASRMAALLGVPVDQINEGVTQTFNILKVKHRTAKRKGKTGSGLTPEQITRMMAAVAK